MQFPIRQLLLFLTFNPLAVNHYLLTLRWKQKKKKKTEMIDKINLRIKTIKLRNKTL